ncbi:Epoxyqueuosine reductase [Sporomusa rhizae]|uniref:4Fe-4S binding protein n=1 Tax=Sporomusa rhizae TaxID=357999 RepID=UPI00352B98E5
MDKTTICTVAAQFVEASKYNYVAEEIAISPRVVGLKMFEEPLCAIGSATDRYFNELKKNTAIGEHFLLPQQWLPEAKTVISFFFPFTKEVKTTNNRDKVWPSDEWLHARIEGQEFINKFAIYIKSVLQDAGYKGVAPSLDERFWSKSAFNSATVHPEASFTSNWSERHVAFVCGLGTFGLSKGLITSKGMAGRFTSLITDLELTPDTRNYRDIYEYCSHCGACVKKCPTGAISLEEGKDHPTCCAFVGTTAEKYAPRYGCGKCQTGVPCESKIPLPMVR